MAVASATIIMTAFSAFLTPNLLTKRAATVPRTAIETAITTLNANIFNNFVNPIAGIFSNMMADTNIAVANATNTKGISHILFLPTFFSII